jgi:hypothetical protein
VFPQFVNAFLLILGPVGSVSCGHSFHPSHAQTAYPGGPISAEWPRRVRFRGLHHQQNALVLDGQPEGRASTARLLAVGGECAEGGKLFERGIDAFAIDVAIEETTDLIP